MRFNRRGRLDPSQVSDQRSRGRGGTIAAGGGIGVVLLAVLAMCTGANPAGLLADDAPVQAPAGDIGNLEQECQVVADIDDNADCRFVLYVNSIQDYWDAEFARRGARYQPAVTTFFSDGVRTACGAASSQVGPFYCPADQGVYLDLGFFSELRNRFGVDTGAFGEAYVLAHEYGHHIQNLTGQMQQLRQGSGPTSDAVRLELQADCYAGAWAHHATTTPADDGLPLILELTEQDVRQGLTAAAAVGDDYIQQRFQGTVTPEVWTHGSSEQRQQWFATGLQTGQLEACDTFSAAEL
ncbi:MAG TPA: neutral zinc metallopeptidase [Jiangellaceae bacterium]